MRQPVLVPRPCASALHDADVRIACNLGAMGCRCVIETLRRQFDIKLRSNPGKCLAQLLAGNDAQFLEASLRQKHSMNSRLPGGDKKLDRASAFNDGDLPVQVIAGFVLAWLNMIVIFQVRAWTPTNIDCGATYPWIAPKEGSNLVRGERRGRQPVGSGQF